MSFPSSGGGYQVGDGNLNELTLGARAAPQTSTASATLTPAQITGGMLVANPSATAATYILPTVALLEATVINPKVGSVFDLAVVNIGTGAGALTFAAGVGMTLVGVVVVAITSSAQFRFRKTGEGSWTVYRVA